MSHTVRTKAFNRLKVAKEIFRSKLTQDIVKQSNLKAQVASICNYTNTAAQNPSTTEKANNAETQ